MSGNGSTQTRTSHWIPRNHQCRIPERWVVFDTEAKSSFHGNLETQTWRMGAAIRWRHGLKRGDQMEKTTFTDPVALWTWVSEFCRKGTRTVALAHNLGYDVRTTQALEILPTLGFELEWCNLDSNVSAMTWRSDHGTLVLADTWTWLPVQLSTLGTDLGTVKLSMPGDSATRASWERYCLRDCEILYAAVSDLLKFLSENDCGNWQPTGAGMAYATWRHKFMTHKILVHDNMDVIAMERQAMHTGRAEAWRHGELELTVWSEVDMKDAYVRIAAECELPAKMKYITGALSYDQYSKLRDRYRVLCRCDVSTDIPCVPYHTGTNTQWPVGQFETILWDTELDLLYESGQHAKILEAVVYTREPVLRDWAEWILSITGPAGADISPVVRTWAKHCGRALIGRLSLRCPQWELYGANPDGDTGISYGVDIRTGQRTRFMHVGGRTLRETEKLEGRDSLPQVTGWIMAECRARLWRAMSVARTSDVGHVDTDAMLVTAAGLARLRGTLGADLGGAWAVKGSWRRVIVYGPRNYRTGKLRKTAGVPKRAEEVLPNVFTGERWHGVAHDLESGHADRVTIETGTWELARSDPRRQTAPGTTTHTVPYVVAGSGALSSSNSASAGCGA